mmetsp:Transcript_22668/g.27380  ORF Transcript_22668/g.27380 Transcript_22668/m.27380 type:complete len:441 (+) Transcript_22668:399-1721(+)|eukprot:CAMPEP_0197860470 /NCGR_PEP_ID=MMETSP1438-20131217/35860_1 /TAXON_ID=1461541 /ORGANISM="Pterosperma sp., Strain CCMP1384" /LENGTH=440 /DNA_ID=CAMNT_0043477345 /DNA_START=393 /DNA_END=1715 /DNA_ORIENTATION=-
MQTTLGGMNTKLNLNAARTRHQQGAVRSSLLKPTTPATQLRAVVRSKKSVNDVSSSASTVASLSPVKDASLSRSAQRLPRLTAGSRFSVRCQAAATASSSSDASSGLPSLGKTAYLGVLFVMWYGFSVSFGIFNKQVLNVFPYPTTLTLLNLAVGSVMACMMWAAGLHARPQVDRKTLITILPLALVHTLGNLLTNISLGKVAVSFTHTIKSCEPFFSVVMQAVFLGDIPSLALVATLIPVVGGIALASFTETSFNWVGLMAALGSNVTFTSRNVFSKKLMKNVDLDNINLFSIITIMSMFACAPVTLALEGLQLTPAVVTGPVFAAIASKALLAGISFHSYQQISYMVLQNVSPVTHSVGKCVKSVVVIVASILFFGNYVGPLNMAGTALALIGVCMYSYVKIQQKKRDAAAAEEAEKKKLAKAKDEDCDFDCDVSGKY